jgi:hypothetical protein
MFEHAYPLLDGVRALMPPQGLLVIAAVLPASWEIRLIDENIRPATRDDYLWADAVFVTGMHAQRRQIETICRRAHMFDRTSVLGGSSVSACPEHYPEFDYLHVGELGDATDELIARLTRDVSRPESQVVLTTRERRDLTDFPIPAYELAELRRYMTLSIQYSSGCPHQCELRHPDALWTQSPLKDAGSDHRRAGEAAHLRRRWGGRPDLFRRRQFHRQSARCARTPPGADRVAKKPRLPLHVRLRGDA